MRRLARAVPMWTSRSLRPILLMAAGLLSRCLLGPGLLDCGWFLGRRRPGNQDGQECGSQDCDHQQDLPYGSARLHRRSAATHL